MRSVKLASLFAALAMFAVVATSQASEIGMHWAGYAGSSDTSIPAATVDGVVPQANWNNIQANWDKINGSGALVDSAGNATTAVVHAPGNGFTFWWVNNSNAEPLLNGPWGGDDGSGGTNPTDCNTKITGIPYATYDIIFYVNENGPGDMVRKAWLDSNPGTIYYFGSPGDTISTFVEITNTDSTQHPLGNYIRFTGLSVDTQVLNTMGDAGGTNSESGGFQIIDTSVPEPMTMSLLVLGAVGMIARRRRIA
jgi:hypothetical protein